MLLLALLLQLLHGSAFAAVVDAVYAAAAEC
jgi:hypothetical protein